MKRFWILLLVLTLCLSGCRKKQSDIPGGQEVPEDIDWKLWEQYTPATLQMGEDRVDVLIALDEIHLAVYYDQDQQKLLGSLTILEPLSDVDYSRERLRILDQNGDGYDDICIPDLLPAGDRTISWWLWDPKEKSFVFAPEQTQYQQDIAEDISWMAGLEFINATMDTPDGPRDLLILVEGQELLIYLDDREQIPVDRVSIPAPLSAEAQEHLSIYTYWECMDLSGDGWGDLQLPYRWEEKEDGSVYQYAYCWIWDPAGEKYIYDAVASAEPVM